MADTPESQTGATPTWPPAFRAGLEPLVAFVVVLGGLLVAVNVGLPRVLGPDPAPLVDRASSVPWKLVEGALAVAVLRYEGVRLRDVGGSPRLLVPALVTAAGVVVSTNTVVAGLVVLGGGNLSVGVGAFFRSPPLNYTSGEIVVGAVVAYAFTGPAEELAFRGYLQNKLVALLGGDRDYGRTALGIAAAGAVFAGAHLPGLLVGGGNLTAVVPTLATLAFTGIGFGIVYETTRNLYLVALLHGFGNHYPLFVDPGTWPNWPVIVGLYALMVVVYRQWAARTSRPTHGIGDTGGPGASTA